MFRASARHNRSGCYLFALTFNGDAARGEGYLRSNVLCVWYLRESKVGGGSLNLQGVFSQCLSIVSARGPPCSFWCVFGDGLCGASQVAAGLRNARARRGKYHLVELLYEDVALGEAPSPRGQT